MLCCYIYKVPPYLQYYHSLGLSTSREHNHCQYNSYLLACMETAESFSLKARLPSTVALKLPTVRDGAFSETALSQSCASEITISNLHPPTGTFHLLSSPLASSPKPTVSANTRAHTQTHTVCKIVSAAC